MEAFDGMKRVPYQPTLPKSIRPYQTQSLDAPRGVSFTSPVEAANQGHKVRVALPNATQVKKEYKYQRDHTKLRVGYADDLEVHYSPDDQLVYGTANHFTKKILESKHLSGDLIFIRQSPETYLLERLLRFSGSPKVVLLSDSFSGKEIFLPPETQISEIIQGETGTGVIFRSGVEEVNEMVRALNKSTKVFPAYGPLSQVELDVIMSSPEKTKVIIGTGLSPIPGINFVVDDLLQKVPELTSNGGIQLVQRMISPEESKKRNFGQRNYKLMTQMTSSPKEPILYQSILQLIGAGLDPDQILGVSTEFYRSVLTKFGLLKEEKGRLLLTPEGKFVSEIPLRFPNALIVALAYRKFVNAVIKNSDIVQKKVLLRTAIAVSSMIEVYGPGFFLPLWQQPGQSDAEFSAQKREYTSKYHQRFIGQTTIHTLVNIFWEMLSDVDVAKKYDQASRGPFINYLQEWSLNNQMNYQKMKEFFILMRAVESIVESMIHLELDPRTISPQLRQAEILPRGELGREGFSLNWQLPAGGYDALGNQVAKLFAQANILNRYDSQGNGVYINPETGLTYRVEKADTPSLIVDPISGIWIPGSSL